MECADGVDVGHRVLITGGLGFIGHALTSRLTRRADVRVVVGDVALGAAVSGPCLAAQIVARRHLRVARMAEVVAIDVRDEQAVRDTVKAVDPTVVIHLAAVSSASDARHDPDAAEQTNIGGVAAVLRALRGRAVRLVFVSSSFVYGDFGTPVVDENHPLRPHGVYGQTKLRGEQMVRAERDEHGLSAVVVRPSAVYGPYSGNRSVVQALVEDAINGVPGSIRGEGSVLDFTYVDDIAAGLEAAALHPNAPGRVLNMTAGQGRSLGHLREIILKHFPDHTIATEPVDPNTPMRGTLDIGRARRYLGYQPEWSLESGVARMVSFYRGLVAEANEADR